MKPTFPLRAAVAVSLPLLLAACGHHDPAPAVEVTELAAGTYAVSAGDANNPTSGKYYAAADGSRLLVLNNSAQQAAALYRRDGNAHWQATPAATQASSLALLNSSAIPSAVLNFTAIAGSYTVRLASGAVAALAVTANGDIVAGATSCKLSGKLATATLPDALKLSLTTAGCGDLPAKSEGYLVVDKDYAPAAFRLLADGGNTLIDMWAYTE